MRRVLYAALAILSILWTFGAAAFLIEAYRALRVPEERDYGEGIVMWQAMHVTDLKTAYHSIAHYPYVIFHYPPIFHLLARAAALLTGNLLIGGRLVSIVSFLLACGLLGLIAWRSLAGCRNRPARVLGSLCAASIGFSSVVIPWACLFRVDLAAVLFTLIGLALYISSPGKPRRAFAAYAFFIIAVYTKQTMLAAPLVCLLGAWLEDRKLALRLLLFTFASGCAVLLLFTAATDGWFTTNLFLYNKNPFTLEHLVTQWSSHLQLSFVIPLLASLAAAGMALFRGQKRGWKLMDSLRRGLRGNRLKRCILIVSGYLAVALLTTIALGKEGANYNYFLEVDLAIALLSGLFLGAISDMAVRKPTRYATVLLLAVAGFVFQALPNPGSLQFTLSRLSLPSTDAQLAEYVKKTPGPMYGENMVVLVSAGKEIAAEPAIITSLAKNATWDETDFVQSIRNRKFSAIEVSTKLDNRERFTAAVADAIHTAYPEAVQFSRFTIYLPHRSEMVNGFQDNGKIAN